MKKIISSTPNSHCEVRKHILPKRQQRVQTTQGPVINDLTEKQEPD